MDGWGSIDWFGMVRFGLVRIGFTCISLDCGVGWARVGVQQHTGG